MSHELLNNHEALIVRELRMSAMDREGQLLGAYSGQAYSIIIQRLQSSFPTSLIYPRCVPECFPHSSKASPCCKQTVNGSKNETEIHGCVGYQSLLNLPNVVHWVLTVARVIVTNCGLCAHGCKTHQSQGWVGGLHSALTNLLLISYDIQVSPSTMQCDFHNCADHNHELFLVWHVDKPNGHDYLLGPPPAMFGHTISCHLFVYPLAWLGLPLNE